MPRMTYPRQLLLDLNVGYNQTFDNFIGRENRSVCEALMNLDPFIAGYDYSACCWSELSCGKSHLLRAYCAYWQEQGMQINYLSGGNLLLNDVDLSSKNLSVLVFDDIQNLLMDRAKEEDLLYMLLHCYENDLPFICSANNHPSKLECVLDDLATRLATFYSFELQPLKGKELELFIQFQARQRRIQLEPELVSTILAELNLDMKLLRSLLKNLAHDKSGRTITAADLNLAAASLRN